MITMSGKDEDPHIILSRSILLTNNSSSKVVHDFLTTQLDKAILDYGITNLDEGPKFNLIFKYKKLL
jgi:hypothetical protein